MSTLKKFTVITVNERGYDKGDNRVEYARSLAELAIWLENTGENVRVISEIGTEKIALPPKSFTVAAISQNRNGFGLHGIVLIADDGEAYEVAGSIRPGFDLAVGESVSLATSDNPFAGDPTARWQWQDLVRQISFEIPKALPKAPASVLAALKHKK